MFGSQAVPVFLHKRGTKRVSADPRRTTLLSLFSDHLFRLSLCSPPSLSHSSLSLSFSVSLSLSGNAVLRSGTARKVRGGKKPFRLQFAPSTIFIPETCEITLTHMCKLHHKCTVLHDYNLF